MIRSPFIFKAEEEGVLIDPSQGNCASTDQCLSPTRSSHYSSSLAIVFEEGDTNASLSPSAAIKGDQRHSLDLRKPASITPTEFAACVSSGLTEASSRPKPQRTRSLPGNSIKPALSTPTFAECLEQALGLSSLQPLNPMLLKEMWTTKVSDDHISKWVDCNGDSSPMSMQKALVVGSPTLQSQMTHESISSSVPGGPRSAPVSPSETSPAIPHRAESALELGTNVERRVRGGLQRGTWEGKVRRGVRPGHNSSMSPERGASRSLPSSFADDTLNPGAQQLGVNTNGFRDQADRSSAGSLTSISLETRDSAEGKVRGGMRTKDKRVRGGQLISLSKSSVENLYGLSSAASLPTNLSSSFLVGSLYASSSQQLCEVFGSCPPVAPLSPSPSMGTIYKVRPQSTSQGGQPGLLTAKSMDMRMAAHQSFGDMVSRNSSMMSLLEYAEEAAAGNVRKLARAQSDVGSMSFDHSFLSASCGLAVHTSKTYSLSSPKPASNSLEATVVSPVKGAARSVDYLSERARF